MAMKRRAPLHKLFDYLRTMGFDVRAHQQDVKILTMGLERNIPYYYLTAVYIGCQTETNSVPMEIDSSATAQPTAQPTPRPTPFASKYWFAYNKKRHQYVYSVDPQHHFHYYNFNLPGAIEPTRSHTDIPFDYPEEFPLVRIKESLIYANQYSHTVSHHDNGYKQISYQTTQGFHVSWKNDLGKFVVSEKLQYQSTDQSFDDVIDILTYISKQDNSQIFWNRILDIIYQNISSNEYITKYSAPMKLVKCKYGLTKWAQDAIQTDPANRNDIIEKIILLIEDYKIFSIYPSHNEFFAALDELKRNLVQLCQERNLKILDTIAIDKNKNIVSAEYDDWLI